MVISLTSYNRFECLQQTIESLFKSNFPIGSILYITDDASTDPRVRPFLESLEPPEKLDIEYNFRKENVGVSINEHEGARYCFTHLTQDDYIVLINNDCIFHPQWMWKLMQAYESLYDAKVGALTAFNYEYNNKSKYGHRVLGWVNEFVRRKESCGALGCMVNRELIMALPVDPGDGWLTLHQLALTDSWATLATECMSPQAITVCPTATILRAALRSALQEKEQCVQTNLA